MPQEGPRPSTASIDTWFPAPHRSALCFLLSSSLFCSADYLRAAVPSSRTAITRVTLRGSSHGNVAMQDLTLYSAAIRYGVLPASKPPRSSRQYKPAKSALRPCAGALAAILRTAISMALGVEALRHSAARHVSTSTVRHPPTDKCLDSCSVGKFRAQPIPAEERLLESIPGQLSCRSERRRRQAPDERDSPRCYVSFPTSPQAAFPLSISSKFMQDCWVVGYTRPPISASSHPQVDTIRFFNKQLMLVYQYFPLQPVPVPVPECFHKRGPTAQCNQAVIYSWGAPILPEVFQSGLCLYTNRLQIPWANTALKWHVGLPASAQPTSGTADALIWVVFPILSYRSYEPAGLNCVIAVRPSSRIG